MAEKRLIDASALHKRIEMNLRASNPFTIEECCYKDALNSVDEAPTIDPKTLRPVAHWEEIPGSYEVCAGKSGSWCVIATYTDKQGNNRTATEIMANKVDFCGGKSDSKPADRAQDAPQNYSQVNTDDFSVIDEDDSFHFD